MSEQRQSEPLRDVSELRGFVDFDQSQHGKFGFTKESLELCQTTILLVLREKRALCKEAGVAFASLSQRLRELKQEKLLIQYLLVQMPKAGERAQDQFKEVIRRSHCSRQLETPQEYLHSKRKHIAQAKRLVVRRGQDESKTWVYWVEPFDADFIRSVCIHFKLMEEEKSSAIVPETLEANQNSLQPKKRDRDSDTTLATPKVEESGKMNKDNSHSSKKVRLDMDRDSSMSDGEYQTEPFSQSNESDMKPDAALYDIKTKTDRNETLEMLSENRARDATQSENSPTPALKITAGICGGGGGSFKPTMKRTLSKRKRDENKTQSQLDSSMIFKQTDNEKQDDRNRYNNIKQDHIKRDRIKQKNHKSKGTAQDDTDDDQNTPLNAIHGFVNHQDCIRNSQTDTPIWCKDTFESSQAAILSMLRDAGANTCSTGLTSPEIKSRLMKQKFPRGALLPFLLSKMSPLGEKAQKRYLKQFRRQKREESKTSGKESDRMGGDDEELEVKQGIESGDTRRIVLRCRRFPQPEIPVYWIEPVNMLCSNQEAGVQPKEGTVSKCSKSSSKKHAVTKRGEESKGKGVSKKVGESKGDVKILGGVDTKERMISKGSKPLQSGHELKENKKSKGAEELKGGKKLTDGIKSFMEAPSKAAKSCRRSGLVDPDKTTEHAKQRSSSANNEDSTSGRSINGLLDYHSGCPRHSTSGRYEYSEESFMSAQRSLLSSLQDQGVTDESHAVDKISILEWQCVQTSQGKVVGPHLLEDLLPRMSHSGENAQEAVSRVCRKNGGCEQVVPFRVGDQVKYEIEQLVLKKKRHRRMVYWVEPLHALCHSSLVGATRDKVASFNLEAKTGFPGVELVEAADTSQLPDCADGGFEENRSHPVFGRDDGDPDVDVVEKSEENSHHAQQTDRDMNDLDENICEASRAEGLQLPLSHDTAMALEMEVHDADITKTDLDLALYGESSLTADAALKASISRILGYGSVCPRQKKGYKYSKETFANAQHSLLSTLQEKGATDMLSGVTKSIILEWKCIYSSALIDVLLARLPPAGKAAQQAVLHTFQETGFCHQGEEVTAPDGEKSHSFSKQLVLKSMRNTGLNQTVFWVETLDALCLSPNSDSREVPLRCPEVEAGSQRFDLERGADDQAMVEFDDGNEDQNVSDIYHHVTCLYTGDSVSEASISGLLDYRSNCPLDSNGKYKYTEGNFMGAQHSLLSTLQERGATDALHAVDTGNIVEWQCVRASKGNKVAEGLLTDLLALLPAAGEIAQQKHLQLFQETGGCDQNGVGTADDSETVQYDSTQLVLKRIHDPEHNFFYWVEPLHALCHSQTRNALGKDASRDHDTHKDLPQVAVSKDTDICKLPKDLDESLQEDKARDTEFGGHDTSNTAVDQNGVQRVEVERDVEDGSLVESDEGIQDRSISEIRHGVLSSNAGDNVSAASISGLLNYRSGCPLDSNGKYRYTEEKFMSAQQSLLSSLKEQGAISAPHAVEKSTIIAWQCVCTSSGGLITESLLDALLPRMSLHGEEAQQNALQVLQETGGCDERGEGTTSIGKRAACDRNQLVLKRRRVKGTLQSYWVEPLYEAWVGPLQTEAEHSKYSGKVSEDLGSSSKFCGQQIVEAMNNAEQTEKVEEIVDNKVNEDDFPGELIGMKADAPVDAVPQKGAAEETYIDARNKLLLALLDNEALDVSSGVSRNFLMEHECVGVSKMKGDKVRNYLLEKLLTRMPSEGTAAQEKFLEAYLQSGQSLEDWKASVHPTRPELLYSPMGVVLQQCRQPSKQLTSNRQLSSCGAAPCRFSVYWAEPVSALCDRIAPPDLDPNKGFNSIEKDLVPTQFELNSFISRSESAEMDIEESQSHPELLLEPWDDVLLRLSDVSGQDTQGLQSNLDSSHPFCESRAVGFLTVETDKLELPLTNFEEARFIQHSAADEREPSNVKGTSDGRRTVLSERAGDVTSSALETLQRCLAQLKSHRKIS